MTVDQILPLLLTHRRVQEELALQLTLQLALQSVVHILQETHDLLTRFYYVSRVQREHYQITVNTNSRRNDLVLHASTQLHIDLRRVHVITHRDLQVIDHSLPSSRNDCDTYRSQNRRNTRSHFTPHGHGKLSELMSRARVHFAAPAITWSLFLSHTSCMQNFTAR